MSETAQVGLKIWTSVSPCLAQLDAAVLDAQVARLGRPTAVLHGAGVPAAVV